MALFQRKFAVIYWTTGMLQVALIKESEKEWLY